MSREQPFQDVGADQHRGYPTGQQEGDDQGDECNDDCLHSQHPAQPGGGCAHYFLGIDAPDAHRGEGGEEVGEIDHSREEHQYADGRQQDGRAAAPCRLRPAP